MLIVTTDTVFGREIGEVIGLVQGSTIQSKHIGKDITAAFKQIIGGELKTYSDMLQDARRVAIERMIADARDRGADAIIGMRISTSSIMSGAAEILAYGTAVKLK